MVIRYQSEYKLIVYLKYSTRILFERLRKWKIKRESRLLAPKRIIRSECEVVTIVAESLLVGTLDPSAFLCLLLYGRVIAFRI
jgi:hypothetical protein